MLWETAMHGVRPIRPKPIVPKLEPLPPPATPVAADPPSQAPAPPPSPPYAPGGVDRATVERLRRGQIAIEARIDLHGMTQAEAHPALMGFIASSIRLGRRAVLVITGKGPVSQGGGVLRRNAPHWLASSPLAPKILTTVSAHAKHGGDGAFYVLLRRARPAQ